MFILSCKFLLVLFLTTFPTQSSAQGSFFKFKLGGWLQLVFVRGFDIYKSFGTSSEFSFINVTLNYTGGAEICSECTDTQQESYNFYNCNDTFTQSFSDPISQLDGNAIVTSIDVILYGSFLCSSNSTNTTMGVTADDGIIDLSVGPLPRKFHPSNCYSKKIDHKDSIRRIIFVIILDYYLS